MPYLLNTDRERLQIKSETLDIGSKKMVYTVEVVFKLKSPANIAHHLKVQLELRGARAEASLKVQQWAKVMLGMPTKTRLATLR